LKTLKQSSYREKHESFNVNVGVRKGDKLSVILFNLVLYYIVKKLYIGEIYQIKWFRSRHMQMTCVIISRNLKALEEGLQVSDNTSKETGLIINQETTKYMKVSKKTHNQCNWTAIGGYTNERVSSFPCLDSVTNDNNSISEEITHRIKKGGRARYAYKGLMTSKLTNTL